SITLRFVLYKSTFRRAFTRPHEALFVPTFFLSIAAILCNVAEYARIFLFNGDISYGGVPSDGNDDDPRASLTSFATFLCVAFWFFSGLTFLASVIQYHLLFTVKAERRLSLTTITPAWVL
ncbi:hypothetical protein OFC03_28155, partial [Escherichia coli]|nr:hypothetical protein [Escherichia coli]